MIDTIFPVPKDAVQFSETTESASCFLIGDSYTCKTSLLFQAGVSKASENEKVIYIGPEKLAALPLHVHGMPNAVPSVTRHITLMYMKTAADLIQFLSQIHVGTALPGAILLDDVHYFVNQLQQESSAEQALAKLCALAKDAAEYSSRKSGHPCLLLASANGGHLKQNYNHICGQFFSQVWQILVTSDLNLANQFTMMSRTISDLRFHYYTENREIFLDKVLRIHQT